MKAQIQPPGISQAVKAALAAKDAAEKDRDALRAELRKIKAERAPERWRRVIATGEEAIEGERTLRKLIDLTRKMIQEQVKLGG